MNMRMANLWLIFLALSIFGCATGQTYNLKQLNQDFLKSIQTHDTAVNSANKDFSEKKLLIGSLGQNDQSPQWKALEPEAQRSMERLEALLKEINLSKANLNELNGQLSAISYNREKINNQDPLWSRTNQISNEFFEGSKNLTENLRKYSSESAQLSDTIRKNKLYSNMDLIDFQKQIQSEIKVSNLKIEEMNSSLVRLEKLVNYSEKASETSQTQTLYDDLGQMAQSFGNHAQKLSELAAKVKDTTMGAAKISSLDPNWKALQTMNQEFLDLKSRLSQLKITFAEKEKTLNKALSKFR